MITALVSAATGLISGMVPDIMREIRDTRDHKREMEMLTLQHQLQMARINSEGAAKIEEARADLMAEEARVYGETLKSIIDNQAIPTGVLWIDSFNALLRPTTVSLVMLLFIVTAGAYVFSVLAQYNSGQISDVTTVANMIWYSLVGESIQAVLGFLFGYRSSNRLPPVSGGWSTTVARG